MNRDLVEKMLLEENGVVRIAWACYQPFKKDPDGVAAEMRTVIPGHVLPDVVFRMAADYVLGGIEPSDESPETRKKIAERTETMNRLFGDELKEGGRRAREKLRRETGR